MSNPTTIEDVLELLKTSTLDVASEQILSANAYKVEEALATIEQLVLERLIGKNHAQEWDSEQGMCHTCGWYVEDGTQDCICIAINKKLEEQRQVLTQLLRGARSDRST